MPFTRAPNCATAPRKLELTCTREQNKQPTADVTLQSSMAGFCQSRTGGREVRPFHPFCSCNAHEAVLDGPAQGKGSLGHCPKKEEVKALLDKLRGESYHDALPALISTRSGLFFRVRQGKKERRQRTMANLVIIGTQWGDEGKGKIVDILAKDADMVVRYQGGSNAGHTVINARDTLPHRQWGRRRSRSPD